MKAAAALIVSFMVFLVAGIAGTFLNGPFDIFAAASLAFLVPYGLLLVFCLRGKSWAYVGSALLSVILILVTAFTFDQKMSPLLLWETMVSTLLFALIALESFKSFVELKKP